MLLAGGVWIQSIAIKAPISSLPAKPSKRKNNRTDETNCFRLHRCVFPGKSNSAFRGVVAICCQGCRVCCIGMSLVDYNSGVTPNQKNWTQQKPLSLTKLSILKNQVDRPEACCRVYLQWFDCEAVPYERGSLPKAGMSWDKPMIMAQWKNGMSPKKNGATFTEYNGPC